MSTLKTGTILSTSKGDFKFRYGTGENPTRLVLLTEDMNGPFDGTYGDEIIYTKEELDRYDVKIKSNGEKLL